ncbi:hypothetical protein AYL99_09294 [Fonsecaea erecta]|uniref:Major facilitator superfamily (MFS) profile domain-containing protein n=1 Tax=Fonsecaea erecta TaxID=1367422 RepID=A0A178ZAJ8_9EURO|nr:hypothetical protein AYL99_09294 [Fonsecaea erecta]OAP56115.1 hypothetical protein AYL99_09294 [Fonsecaea erecta]
MAGGTAINIFRMKALDVPQGVLNWRLWFAVAAFAVLGAARGIDEGLISGAFKSPDFQELINFKSYSEVEQTNIKGNVTAMVQIGSVGGALFAFLVCDRIGRLWATRQLCALWVLGIAIFMGNNGHLGAVYAGRFIAGLGVGQSVVVGPVYLAEIAPAPIRGLCTCVFAGFNYIGILIAYFANYGCAKHLKGTQAQWMVPTSLNFMFAGIIFFLSFFQYESPRYLIKKGEQLKAIANMSRIRNLPTDHDYVVQEITAITAQWHEEQEATKGQGPLGIAKEMFLIPRNLYRLYLGLGAQVLSQWSGAGSITIYAVDLFGLFGIKGSNEALLATAVFGIVKLVAALVCAFVLVDYIGRKRSLVSGISLQALSMIYLAAFLTVVPPSPTEGEDIPMTPSDKAASKGAIFMMYLSGFGWALGWNSMQYLIVAELFPLRIRAVCTSVIMSAHFANQYGNSRAVPNMLLPTSAGGLSPAGTFWFFGAITIFGGIWVWMSIPETAGRALEDMGSLFDLPWYKIGLYGQKHAKLADNEAVQKAEVTIQHVEYDTKERKSEV